MIITHCSLFCSPLTFMAFLSCLFDTLPLSPCLPYGYCTVTACPLSTVCHQACSETELSSGMTTECKSPSFSTVLFVIERSGERLRSLFVFRSLDKRPSCIFIQARMQSCSKRCSSHDYRKHFAAAIHFLVCSSCVDLCCWLIANCANVWRAYQQLEMQEAALITWESSRSMLLYDYPALWM